MERRQVHAGDGVELFCGGGGTGTGAEAAGVSVRLAFNHWEPACLSYKANHPHADVILADVSTTDPYEYALAGTTILYASPECNLHSQSRRVDRPTDDERARKSRATMWDVPRFTEALRPLFVIVENVVHVRRTWPVYEAWLQAMRLLGYDHHHLSLNSAFFPATARLPQAPQSRDRLYIVFIRRGLPVPDLDFHVPGHCTRCDVRVEGVQTFRNPSATVARFDRMGYYYACPRCAAEITPERAVARMALDLTLPAPPMAKRRMSARTLDRVVRGVAKHGRIPMLVQIAGNTFERPGYVRAWPIETTPFPTVTTTATQGLYLPDPGRVGAAGVCLERDRFRSVTVSESMRAMGFPEGHVLLGTPEQQQTMAGNAVTPIVSEAITRRLLPLAA